jgi:ATP-dependent Clp protease ATP-binding subunit ClpA
MGFTTDVETSREREEADLKEKIRKALERSFRPEFLNRIDEVVVFNSLSKEALREIVTIQLRRVIERAREKGVILEFTDAAKGHLVERGFDSHYGARPLKRAIQSYVLNPLAQELIAGHIRAGDHMNVEVRDGKLEFVRVGRKRRSEPAAVAAAAK